MSATFDEGLVRRTTSTNALQSHLDAVVSHGTGQIVALRGRRHVGKSTLVEQFVESAEVPSVYVPGVYGSSVRRQLDDATRAIVESRRPLPDADLLTQAPAASWREWLGRLSVAARSGPVIAVLDEFPWMVAADPALEGELQAQWDRTLEKLPILLVLIGSDVAMMEQLSAHGRPLFGRLRPCAVAPLDPAEVASALPGRSAFDAFDAYLVTGGYPRLLTDLARSGRSPEEYVRASLADSYSPLVTTARLTLDAEFPDAPAAYRVLAAIGSDDTANPGFSDVLSAIQDSSERKALETATTRALKTLTETKSLVEREVPAWAAPGGRLRRYRITDPYLRFWFRYVERRVEQISRGREDLAITAFDRDWASWRGRSIEPVVREALTRLSRDDERLADVETVHPWWTRDGGVEVDVVAMTRDRSSLVGSIKWRRERGVSAREISALHAVRGRVPRAADALVAAVSPSGEVPTGADLAFSADDLLDAWRR
ncbi:ATP-binding protein [Cellulosimicrobium sp. NPDC055967]|uniref:ATP-binding protein n=1 Tax=Cellulosimicrobium sp. NPDC055967 TaxID=3345670 RepID=UPI0035DAEFEF